MTRAAGLPSRLGTPGPGIFSSRGLGREMPRSQNITEEDVIGWLRETNSEIEEQLREYERQRKATRAADTCAAIRLAQHYNELVVAPQIQREANLHKKRCEVYKRINSYSNLRNTPLYKEIKAFYDVTWKAARYAPQDLAAEPEVQLALRRLAGFILAPLIVDGLPIHLLPIPNEWYQWKPENIPSLVEIKARHQKEYRRAHRSIRKAAASVDAAEVEIKEVMRKMKESELVVCGPGSFRTVYDVRDRRAEKELTTLICVARLRKFCDPLEVDLSKRQNEGTARSCADDYTVKLLGKLGISLK